jgi:hypothetical protein
VGQGVSDLFSEFSGSFASLRCKFGKHHKGAETRLRLTSTFAWLWRTSRRGKARGA